MIVCWLLFPLLLVAVCLGCGMLVQWLGGWTLPGGTLLSAGLAVLVCVCGLLTHSTTTAPATTVVVLVLAVLGLVLGHRRLREATLDPWLITVGIGVYLVCAAPMVLSGETSFLGYFVLNDGSFHFALMNHVIDHGHALPTGTPSSYTAMLTSYLRTDYPIGADMVIAALRPLVGQDVAWLFQPFMAVVMALGGTVVYELWRTTIASRPLRALAAFAAAQAGLLYAYYAEASIKEVCTAWLITLTVVTAVATVRRGMTWRGWIVLAVIAVAGYEILGATIAAWIGIPLLVFVLAAAWRTRDLARRHPPRRVIPVAVAVAVVLAAIVAVVVKRSLPQIQVAEDVLTGSSMTGNLGHPLPRLEMVGIWPSSGDFRTPITTGAGHAIAYVLIWIAVASGAAGIAWAIVRRHLEPLLLILSSGIAAAVLLAKGDPYADGKVMMIFSLASIATAMLGPAALYDLLVSRSRAGGGSRAGRVTWRATPAWALAAVITAGVLWTTVQSYRTAAPAPRGRLDELTTIDRRFAGQTPTFFNMSNEYAAYFLRNLAPADSALSAVALRPGIAAPGRNPIDPDNLSLGVVESFRLLVLGNGELGSRPPANFRLAYHGRYYEVWRRTSAPHVLDHHSLGNAVHSTARPACATVHRLARRAAAGHARLAYVAPPPTPSLVPTHAQRSPAWLAIDATTVYTTPPGAVSGSVRLPRTGDYRIAVQGAVSRRLRIEVDGHPVASIARQLGPPGQITTLGTVHLRAGRHQVRVVRAGSRFAPGAETSSTLGPVLFLDRPAATPVSTIAPAQAGRLCGRRLDWIEIVRGG